ncbi:uncharacterized protein [Mytilus edulis]|uniref:uncharacterized protein n=1 Tax=Mytilus edulis TaxID=6550 RepID=UPI0039EFB727
MVKSENDVLRNQYQNQMDRPKTQMSSRTSRASSSRTPRSSIDGLSTLIVGDSILNRPKTALTNFSYLTKKPKPVATEELVELPVCRPTTSVRKRTVRSPPAALAELRPKTAPFPVKSWTQLVRDSSFHEDKSHRRNPEMTVSQPKNAWEECPPDEEEEYRIILIGKAGSGKSSTGNCILNEEIFGKSSSKCRYGTTDRFGKKISVVDTYNVFDKYSDKSVISHELVKLVGLTSPGFHVLVLVLSIGNIDNKEHHVFREFVRHFGNEIKFRTIILFTRRDILDSDGSTIYGYVSDVPKGIQEVMEQCKRRYLAFNNNATGREKDVQVHRLIDMIDNIMKLNNRRHFSSEVYGATEMIIKRRIDDIKRNLKGKLRREQEIIEAQIKMSETPRSVRPTSGFGESATPRSKPSKSKKSTRRKNSKTTSIDNGIEDHFTKLPNLTSHSKENKQRDKHLKHKVNQNDRLSKRRTSSKCDVSFADEDEDFGDCDIEALKRRINEDFDIPTLHLPNEDFFEGSINEENTFREMNGNNLSDSKLSELREKYEGEMSKNRLRERVREECEQEQPELFQMMWKLSRYFDQSVQI